ncbi:MAG: hypothetical protein P8Y12_11970 [Gammaproteobacteria bacterium]
MKQRLTPQKLIYAYYEICIKVTSIQTWEYNVESGTGLSRKRPQSDSSPMDARSMGWADGSGV